MRIGTEVVLWAGFHPYLCRENGNLAGGAVRIGTEVVLWAGFHPYRAGKAEKLIIYATVSKYQFSLLRVYIVGVN